MHIAFYKGTQPGLAGLFNRAVRWWTHGPYSHCELVLDTLPDGAAQCASSSWMDGGVRSKRIVLDPARWDLVAIPFADKAAAYRWFSEHAGEGYDLRGLLGFVWRRGDGDRHRWWCSEAIGAAIGMDQPWRHCPNSLAAVARSAIIWA